MNNQQPVRIGLIGAGTIFRDRHLPNLKALPQVRLVTVANRSEASSSHAAEQFGIEGIDSSWQSLIERDDLDAVMVGTWPYMHRDISVAVLGAGKHLFCQARMAMDLAEARDMLAAADSHPQQVAVICPPGTRMPYEAFIKNQIESGRLGRITLVEMISRSGFNLNTQEVMWREQREYSGKQALFMGIFAETINAWLGPYQTLIAQTATPIAEKTDHGRPVIIEIPQIITITGKLENGALIVEQHHGLVTDTSSPLDQLTIWGTEGTLRCNFDGPVLEMAASGGTLEPVTVASQMQRPWRVEADFVDAVRAAMAGQPWSKGGSPDFAEGLLYMQKVEAVHLSVATGKAVELASL